MLSTPQLLARAVRHGLVTAEEAGQGEVLVRPVPRSNPVHRLERSGEVLAYVKQPGTASMLDGDRLVAVETAVLDALGHTAALPVVLAHDDHGVWLSPLPGVELSGLEVPVPRRGEVAAGLGSALAAVHTTAQPGGTPDPAVPGGVVPGGAVTGGTPAPRARTPWPLDPEPWPSMVGHEGPAVDAVRAVCLQPEVVALREAAARDWETEPPRWVHGDVSAGNVVVDLGEEVPGGGLSCRVGLVDVELGGLGHPAWDLAAALACVADLAADEQHVGELHDRFRTAYLGSGGAGCERWLAAAPRWRGVHALTRAWQCAVSPHDVHHALVDGLLAGARVAATRTAAEAP